MLTPQQIETYFTKKKPSIFTFIGCAFFAIGGLFLIADGEFFSGFAVLIFFGGGGALAYLTYKNFPTDAQIDETFEQIKEMRKKQVFSKLGINEEDIIREPLTIIGFNSYTHSKKGEDGVYRFNPMQMEAIYFTNNQLLIASVEIDIMCQSESDYSGRTNEFFYRDISTVSIYDEDNSKRFIIKVHGQNECNIRINTSNKQSLVAAEEAVISIRKALRENKA
ncbi:hypothetical protein LS68_000050 [Helicobacter sp. MIT 05-5293]|uniref:hypothetical protein n=1 Tax=Helicobacter sp. MIT 05-5293 TaxID=1548149 RepID=UPI00051D0DDF|nr:hypothetical protein [Helicobacter sp. MIT 05-5293]TLD81474.1 hypothetical protein LS68_000050 [Helicobacter sp. MIT 05-5293]